MPPCQTLPLYTTHLLHRRVITGVMDGPGTPPAPPRRGQECGRAEPPRPRPARTPPATIYGLYIFAGSRYRQRNGWLYFMNPRLGSRDSGVPSMYGALLSRA